MATWIVSLLKLLAMAVGCVNQANAAPHEKHDALPLSIQLPVLEDCSGYCSVGCDKCFSLDTQRMTCHGAPSCVIEILCAQ